MRFLSDTFAIFGHNMRLMLRSPFWVAMGVFQPVLYLLLFAPLLDPLSSSPGFPAGGGLAVFTPGAMLMVSLFGPLFSGFFMIAQIKSGEIERLTVTPASRLALLMGNVLRDVAQLVLQGVLLVLVAMLLGLQIKSFGGIALALLILLLLGTLLASCSYGLALTFKSEGALSSIVQTFTQPILLLSGIFLPLSLAPSWLQGIASVNPLSHVMDTMRALFAGNLADPNVVKGFAILLPLMLLAMFWAGRSYRKFNT
jgi:ABC-2 type transport system permease protein